MYERELVNIRRRLDWSQAELATRFGVNQATISRWEAFGVPQRIQVDSRPVIDLVLKTIHEEITSTNWKDIRNE